MLKEEYYVDKVRKRPYFHVVFLHPNIQLEHKKRKWYLWTDWRENGKEEENGGKSDLLCLVGWRKWYLWANGWKFVIKKFILQQVLFVSIHFISSIFCLSKRYKGDKSVFVQVSGPSGQMTWIRGGPMSLNTENILEAIDNRSNYGYTWNNFPCRESYFQVSEIVSNCWPITLVCY